MNINWGSARTKRCHFIKRGMLQLRQPYIRMTGFRQEAPQQLCVVTSPANKGGLHGGTPKEISIANVFVIDGL